MGRKIVRLQEKLQGLKGRQGNNNVLDEIQETKLEQNKMLLVEEDM